MPSPLDIIEIPGWPSRYARRFIVEMWQDAGSPPINSAGRLYSEQLEAWNAYQNHTGSPADDPDRPDIFPLAHVRFVALDVPPLYGPAMIRAGFVMPYDYEPWHFQVAGDVRRFDLVTSIPSTASGGAQPFEPKPDPEEDDMGFYYAPVDGSKPFMFFNQSRGKSREISQPEWAMLRALQRGAVPPLRLELHQVSTHWYDKTLALGTY